MLINALINKHVLYIDAGIHMTHVVVKVSSSLVHVLQ